MMSDHRFVTHVTILLAAVLVLSVPLRAQTATNDWSRLNTVELDSKLSIKLKTGKSIEGRLISFSESTLSMKIKNQTQEIRRDEVQTINRVVGKSVLTATLLGTGIGAGVGGALGAIGSDDSDFDKLDQAIVAGMIAVGAIIGTVAGYFIGRTRKTKILIYEAR